MDFTKAVAIVIASELAPSMVDTLIADPAKFEAESATNEMQRSVAPDGP
jgi:hypothetical protein